jgi:uncharacterized protein (DUF1810 family)
VADNPGAGDPHDLTRFVEAQEGVYTQALAEVRAGRKRSHWMWFIFPQIDGLGSSPMAKRYAIKGRAEAEAYLAHPVLGLRLVACASVPGPSSALDVFGSPDDLKLRSSATLFACVSPAGSVFEKVLVRYFNGERDPATLRLLGAERVLGQRLLPVEDARARDGPVDTLGRGAPRLQVAAKQVVADLLWAGVGKLGPDDPLPVPEVMLGRPKDRLNSWVVAKATGRPIWYAEADLHPALLERDAVIEKPGVLREWLVEAR